MAKSNKFKPVAKRQVFYLPGFDPHPPRRYRELYRKESALAAEAFECQINIKAERQKKQEYGWYIDAECDGQTIDTKYDILFWSDMVQKSVSLSVLQTLVLLGETVWVYVTSLSIFRLMRVKREPIVVALYPVFVLMVELLGSILWGFIVGYVASYFIPIWAACLVGVGLASIIMPILKRLDSRIYAYFLMSDYGFSAANNGANSDELKERISEFATRIGKAAQGDFDEVLIIGHSSGAHIAVGVLAEMLRNTPETKAKIGFLTLGQVIPMLSYLPDARELRRDLYELSISDRIFWLDVTAPTDHCCFSLTDPVALSGQASAEQKWPIAISAAFSRTMNEERYQELKRSYFSIHFQYLCHLNAPEDFDFFKITAGPQSLHERFHETQSSPSLSYGPQSMYVDRAE